MSAEPSAKMQSQKQQELRAALIAMCRLSAEAVREITAAMDSMHMTFSDAAVQLGLVTPKDVEDSMNWATRNQAADDAGLFETAVRKMSGRRDMVVREGTSVRPGEQVVFVRDPYNPHSEKIRALRTELLLRCQATGKGVSIGLVSAFAGEGRTLLATELALAFAQLGQRVLLVDADLRNPQLHRLFDTDNEWGLSQALERRESPLMHRVEGLPHMSLLNAGPIPPNPLELLSDGRFERLERHWRDTYDFVIIDTPPISQCADGLAVATIAGRVLVVNRARHTTFAGAKEMLRRLPATQTQILGAVINHF